jgi:hypothetical protein
MAAGVAKHFPAKKKPSSKEKNRSRKGYFLAGSLVEKQFSITILFYS